MLANLRGKRTYVVAGVMIVATSLKALGVIDDSVYEAVMGVLAALGFGALRAGVDKAGTEMQGTKSI